MKRYRWLDFYIDTQRNFIKIPGVSQAEKSREIFRFAEQIAVEYGSGQLQSKLDRWLQISPPSLCVPIEYHELLREVEGAYVRGDYYPALTAACCLGERILNHLVLELRDHFKSSSHYKKVYRKGSIDKWEDAIEILKDWKCINDEQAKLFFDLLELRNPSVHFGKVQERAAMSAKALNITYKITRSLFSESNPRFLFANGEIYIKKEFETDPLTIHFIKPHCHYVGYLHDIKNINGQNTIVDDHGYSEGEISDTEFIERRAQKKTVGLPKNS